MALVHGSIILTTDLKHTGCEDVHWTDVTQDDFLISSSYIAVILVG